MLKEDGRKKHFILLFVGMLLWAMSFVWVKVALQVYSPLIILLLRMFIGAVFLFSFSRLIGRLQKVQFADLKHFCLLALFEPFLYFMGETYAMQHVSSTVGAVMTSTIPVLTPIASYFFLKQKLTLKHMLGAALSTIGVVLVLVNSGDTLQGNMKGVLLMLVAIVAAIAFSMLISKMGTKYNAMTVISYQTLFSCAYFGVALLFNLDLLKTNWVFDYDAFMSIVYLAVLCTGVSFVIYTMAIQEIGANQASMFTNLIPIFVAVISYFFFDEVLSIKNYLGILLVIVGLFVAHGKIFKKGILFTPHS
ncbi:MAG: DMT family transporter [Bacteroidales bacterium]